MEASTDAQFKKNYQTHLQHLKLKGLRPKTIEAYSRAIRRIGERFNHQEDIKPIERACFDLITADTSTVH